MKPFVMKIRLFLVGLFASLCLISCKNSEEKAQDSTIAQETKPTNAFRVTLTAIIPNDDSFQLYYNQDGYEAPYKEENSLWKEMKGNTTPQDIVFDLPEDVIPSYLRLDFGTNENQKEVTIRNIKIEYLNKKFEARDGQFFNYFIPNESIKSTDKVTGKVVLGKKPDNSYDPLFYSEKALYDEIQKLLK